MSPHESVRRLLNILRHVEPPFGQEDIHPMLLQTGMADENADKAFKFSQIWCGRQFLAGLGVQFSPGYFWFNGSGEVVDRGLIGEEPFYRAARGMIEPGFNKESALTHPAPCSSGVHAVNGLLNRGSQAADLVTSPAFLFTEMPSEAGGASAERFITAHMQSLSPPPLKKPWWRF